MAFPRLFKGSIGAAKKFDLKIYPKSVIFWGLTARDNYFAGFKLPGAALGIKSPRQSRRREKRQNT
jgi:hypothetical protein